LLPPISAATLRRFSPLAYVIFRMRRHYFAASFFVTVAISRHAITITTPSRFIDISLLATIFRCRRHQPRHGRLFRLLILRHKLSLLPFLHSFALPPLAASPSPMPFHSISFSMMLMLAIFFAHCRSSFSCHAACR